MGPADGSKCTRSSADSKCGIAVLAEALSLQPLLFLKGVATAATCPRRRGMIRRASLVDVASRACEQRGSALKSLVAVFGRGW